MQVHKRDSRIACLDNIAEGSYLRRTMLQRWFNKPAKFAGAVHTSPQLLALSARANELMPFLEDIFSADDADWSHALQVDSDKGIVRAQDIRWLGQRIERLESGHRVMKRPKLALHEFGMSAEMGALTKIFSDFAKYVQPITGKKALLYIASRTSTAPHLHRDEKLDFVTDSNVVTFPLAPGHASTRIQNEMGDMIVPPDNALVAVNETVLHESPATSEFRPVIIAQPRAEAGLF